MNKPLRFGFPLTILLGSVLAIGAATAPTTAPQDRSTLFENEIKHYEELDAQQMPPKDAVLFYGSSSIRKWTTLKDDLPELTSINRGFGGSMIPECVEYVPRIVTPYKPKLIVFYAGDNDIGAGHSPEQVFKDYKAFVDAVHESLPDTKILFVSIKPSPSREKWMSKMQETNTLIHTFTLTRPYLNYVDVASAMLDDKGEPKGDLFGPDRLHMNHEGYAIWAKIIGPVIGEMK